MSMPPHPAGGGTPTAEALLRAAIRLEWLRDAALGGPPLNYDSLPSAEEFVEVITTLEQLADRLRAEEAG